MANAALHTVKQHGWHDLQLVQGKGIGRYMVVRTVQALKAEQIGNICLFADAEGVSPPILTCSGVAYLHAKVHLLIVPFAHDSPQCVSLQLWASTSNWGSRLILTECEECSGISADDMLYNDKSINLYH